MSSLALVEEQLAIQQEDVNSEATNSDENAEAEELNPGGQETMLENNQTHNVGIPRITMAPGEGQRPLDGKRFTKMQASLLSLVNLLSSVQPVTAI